MDAPLSITTTMAGWIFFCFRERGWTATRLKRRTVCTKTIVTEHSPMSLRKAGLQAVGWANGVCVGDYNNDGFDDIFCTYFGQNRLYPQ